LPAQLRAAIHQLTAPLGALAEEGEAGGSEAMAGAARAARFADEAPHGRGTHALLIASIIPDCARDRYRVAVPNRSSEDRGGRSWLPG
jgi:hypothetical protein